MRVIFEKHHKAKAKEIADYLSSDKKNKKLNKWTDAFLIISKIAGIIAVFLSGGVAFISLWKKICNENAFFVVYKNETILIYILAVCLLGISFVFLKYAEKRSKEIDRRMKLFSEEDFFNYHLLSEREQIPFDVCVCVKYTDDYFLELPAEFELIGKGKVIAINLHSKKIYRGEIEEIKADETFE